MFISNPNLLQNKRVKKRLLSNIFYFGFNKAQNISLS